MEPSISRSGSLNLTKQIKQKIADDIENEVYPSGGKIPTEKQFCEQFKVSRITVKNAILELVNEGMLYRIKGKGTFVRKKKYELNFLYRDTSFHEQILTSGIIPTSRVLSMDVRQADRDIAERLGIEKEGRFIHLLRLRLVNQEPVAVVESFLPFDLCSFILGHDFTKESLHVLLNTKEQSKIVRVTRDVEAVETTKTEKMLLGVANSSPLLFFTNYSYNANGRVVDYCMSYYRGDRSKFSIEILQI